MNGKRKTKGVMQTVGGEAFSFANAKTEDGNQVVDALASLLREYAERYETPDFLTGDPSWWMHQVEGAENQEAMAFVAAGLSYGSRKQFMPKIGQLLEWSGGEVDAWVRSGQYQSHFSPGDVSCFYRLYNNDCMWRFLQAYRQLLCQHGTLGRYVRSKASTGIEAVEAICTFFRSHDGGPVIPKDATSACKRICMFLRWMVRNGSPVDLGLWADFIPRSTLIMPLDTHVVAESVRLGLMAKSATSMHAAQALTATLALVFPDDPLRADFALFGFGVDGN